MKGKIINDPVYGFLAFRQDLILEVIAHPYFQRLRRIRQMGMANYVYPGATHTRFHHSLGAAHLMKLAIATIQDKGVAIPEETALAAQIAILLHDIGHGPFSHALERSIVNGMHHEELSLILMEQINEDLGGRITEAIAIFKGEHPTKYLTQLVSGQLDMDRMDYLNRDSFYTGVSEGVIGYDRILQMINVHNEALVVESKGIHSVEKFLIARRMMYWQVYLHKAVLGTEHLLINIMRRAKELANDGVALFASPSFSYFLYQPIAKTDFKKNAEPLQHFVALDDADLIVSIKVWQDHSDPILSRLCTMMIERKLFKVQLSTEDLQPQFEKMQERIRASGQYSELEMSYYMVNGKTGNDTYNAKENINILFKNGQIQDITEIENALITQEIAKPVEKSFIGIIPAFAIYL